MWARCPRNTGGATDNKGRLRLARIAGESVFEEKVLPGARLTNDLVGLIAAQAQGLVEEMEAEWRADPLSEELGEGFRLLTRYLDRLKKHRGKSK